MKRFKKITIISGSFILIAIFIFLLFKSGSNISNKTSYQSREFSAVVGQQNDNIKAQFSSGGSQITFTLADQKAKKVGANSYELENDTRIDYEIRKEGQHQGLKETIILTNARASSEFTFNLNLRDVKTFKPNPADNSWRFYNQEGREVFYIPAGFMADSKGARSEKVDIGIIQKGYNYELKVSADKNWIASPDRIFPIKIDPSVIVSGTIDDTEAQFGGLQKKVVYVNSNWYAFYTDGTDVFYKKSSDGATWGSAVDVDTTDADNINPTTWVEGSLIYVAWIDDTTDSIEVNTINTASADALGTKCTSADQGTIDTNTFTVAATLVDNGTVYFAYSDTSTDTEAAVYKLVFSGCTFTDITTGSGLTAGDRPVLTSKGNEAHMVFQDGDLSASVYDGTIWINSNETLAAVTDNVYDVATDGVAVFIPTVSGSSTVSLYSYSGLSTTITDIDTSVGLSTFGAATSIYCPTADDCKVAYFDGTDWDITFVDCDNAACSASTITDIDADAGNTNDGQVSIYCPTATDCKVAYYDGTELDINFADCNNATCTAKTINDIDTDAGTTARGQTSIYCPTADDCKVAYFDGTDFDITFVDCEDGDCSAPNAITDIDTAAGTSGKASIYCPTADDCKVAYYDGTDLDISFVDCDNDACSALAISDIDISAGTTTNGQTSIYCPTADDCKVAYFDGTDLDITFADCKNAACTASTITDIDTDAAVFGKVSIYCPTATDCKVAYHDGTDFDITFADCNSAICSAVISSNTPPWVGQTNVTSVAATYTDMKLYVAAIMDTSEQAYWKVTSTNSISWSAATSFAFTAGDLGQISIYFTDTDEIEAILRQTANLEFSDQNKEKIRIQGKTTIKNKNTFK